MRDVELERYRREVVRPTRPFAGFGGSAAFVGKVVTRGAVAQFMTVNPVAVLGSESAGGAGSYDVDTSFTVPVYLAGPAVPAVGDYLVCRRVAHRWVADRAGGATNVCATTWPKVLTYLGSVNQAQSGFYFANLPRPMAPEPTYTLTYGPRPSDVPALLQIEYFLAPGGIIPPYYITVPDNAWWSPSIPIYLFSSNTTCYFYLWFKGCLANVMVVDAPYGRGGVPGGPLITEGAGNHIMTYIVTQPGDSTHPIQLKVGPFSGLPVVISGVHGSDDIVPDAQGGAGYPTPVRTGP